MASEAQVIDTTRNWIERAVIGLNLCPFARTVHVEGRIRFRVSTATSMVELQEDLEDELQRLVATDASEIDTTLLIHPDVLQDFLEFNDFLEVAEATLDDLELDGVIQIASFHPRFQFAESGADDIENYTNRAPYPILHLLREDSLSRVLEKIDDPDAIYLRNIARLRELGKAGWDALWKE